MQIEEIFERLLKVGSALRWRFVEEELPEEKVLVLVHLSPAGGRCPYGVGYRAHGQWQNAAARDVELHPLAWLPINPPPALDLEEEALHADTSAAAVTLGEEVPA